jgi:hypothetical protein
MHLADVTALQRHREYPSVSVILATEPAARPTELDRARVRSRIEDLARRLHGDVETATTVDLLERLHALADEAETLPARRGVALFASPSRTALVHLDVDVRDRTVVDDTFATRDLVEQARRNVAYEVATVSERRVRVFRGAGVSLEPVEGRGLPLERRDEESDHSWERRVLEVLRRLGGPATPLVLVGAERRVAALVRSGGVDPAGIVRGNHDVTSTAELAELARPHVAAWHASRNAAVLDRLGSARGRRLLATGLDELWWLARDGRVELLVVERSAAVPVRIVGDHLETVPPEDAEAPDVVDDAVDDLIEAVLLRRGDVAIVPDGTLGAGDGLAGALRY